MFKRGRINCQGGFTFNELLVAMGVTVVAILSYSLGTVTVIRGITVTDHSTVALHLAQEKMEQLKAQKSLVNENRCPGAGDVGITANGGPGGIFGRCWTIADSPLGTKLKQIDVKVTWRDHENLEVIISTLLFKG